MITDRKLTPEQERFLNDPVAQKRAVQQLGRALAQLLEMIKQNAPAIQQALTENEKRNHLKA